MIERLTAADVFLLLWDDYGWSSELGALAILDGEELLDPDGRVRTEAVRERLASRLHLVPRFRQLLYRPRLGMGWPLWVDAQSFDVADHIGVHPVAPPGGEAELREACRELFRRRLDQARPLWGLWLLPGLPEGRVGAFFKVHHALADGAAAAAAFGALLDLTRDAPDPGAPPWTPTPTPTATQLLRDNVRRRRRELGRGWSGLTHPRRTIRIARGTLPAWLEVFTEQRAPHTSLNQPVGSDYRIAIVRNRLDVIKEIAHAHRGKANDVVLAAVAGGLRELLASRGEDIHGLVQRAMVPISLHEERPDQVQGNKPGWMMVPLPVGEPDAVRRLDLIAAETAARKHKARPDVGTGIFRFVAGQRLWYRSFPRQRSVNLVVTNVAGPPVPVYLAGARLLELFPVVSVMGNLTLVIAVLSYAGQLNLTAVADRDHCPDLDVFLHGVHSAFTELAREAGGDQQPDLLPQAWGSERSYAMRYPVVFEIERPPVFGRAHVFLRIAVLIVIGWIVHPVGLLWLGLPVVAALLISQKGGQRYLTEDGPTVTRALNWIVDLVAYVALLTDRLPSRHEHAVRFEVERAGAPTGRSALLRILYAIPSVIVLAALTWVGTIVWVFAMVLVLFTGSYPESWWHFLCGIVAWEARLIAYLASLVDRYPPFALAPGSVSPAARSSS